MEPKNIVIIGAGHGGLASAAHSSALGHKVYLVNRSAESIHEVGQAGNITLLYPAHLIDRLFRANVLDIDRTHLTGTPVNGAMSLQIGRPDVAYLECSVAGTASFDDPKLEEIVYEADLIRVIIPSTGHKNVANILAPIIGQKKEQIITLEPGRTGGAIEFLKTLWDYEAQEHKIPWEKICIGETGTFVFASRRLSPTVAYVLGVKDHVPLAALPASDTQQIVKFYQDNLFPQVTQAPNVLYTGFDNMGTIFHPALTLLWISTIGQVQRLKSAGVTVNVQHYADVTESMGRILEGVDEERLTVAKAYGIHIPSARKWLERAYGASGATLAEALNSCRAYQELGIIDNINHRYIFEDARTSALPIAEFGRLAGIECPRLNGVVYMCSDLFPQARFYEDGRTLRNLGLEGMTVQDVIDLAIYGRLR